MASIQDIHSVFQQALGRNATDQEANFYKSMVDQGFVGLPQIGQVLSGLPEAQQNRLPQFAGQYQGALAGQDKQILGLAADTAQARFAAMGRPDSSGVASSIASAGQNLAISRQSLLANFYGGGLNQIQNDYSTLGAGNQDLMNYRQNSLTDYQRSVQDYYRQSNDNQQAIHQAGITGLQSNLLSGGLKLGADLIGRGLGYAAGRAGGGSY